MQRVSAILLITAGLLLAGCPMIDFKELNFTRKKPALEDIVGVWTPTPATLKEIRTRGRYRETTHELVFRSDGTFSMKDMPDWWRGGFGRSSGQFDSGEGKWDLQPAENVWQIWTIRLTFAAKITSVNLYRQKAPYLIFVRVGDPNEGYAMFFERSANR